MNALNTLKKEPRYTNTVSGETQTYSDWVSDAAGWTKDPEDERTPTEIVDDAIRDGELVEED